MGGFPHRLCSGGGGGGGSLWSATRNMGSAVQNPRVVTEYLGKQRQAGRVLGPVDEAARCSVHLSHLGIIPKPHQSGKWRLIVDLSHPHGSSINDEVDSALGSLSYTSVADTLKLALEAGQGGLLAKLDRGVA